MNVDSFRSFYNSKIYPVIVAVLIFLGHAAGQELIFGAILAITLIPALVVARDLRFAILPFLCAIFIVSVHDYTPNDTGYERYLSAPFLIGMSVIAVLLVAALVWFIVRNRTLINPFPKKGMFWSMLPFCAALLINGAFSENYTVSNLFYALATVASLLGVYSLFVLYVRFDRKTLEYFMFCLVVAGLLIVAELLFAYCTTVQFENGQIVKGSIVLGWGVWTNIGGMLSFLMPACFYFAHSHRRGWIGYLLGLFFYFCIVLSQSRGALLVGSAVLALCLLYLCLSGKNRRRNRIITLALVLCGAIGVVLLSSKLIALVQNFMSFGFADNGRFEKWSTGFGHFLDYPVLGSGFYDSYVDLAWDMGVYPYLYHNTVIQLLGATGIVGFLTYLYHRVQTLRLALTRRNAGKSFLALCILSLLLFSMTDVLLFKTYPTIYYALMLLFMEKSEMTKG